jgi:DNA-directed RNA polymerase II subunit RPB1
MSGNKHQNANNASKIMGIQFSILSPDEIKRASVAEITSRDTYVNNKPVIGGLFDPRMGVLEPGLVCPTDGLDYMQTPGYFGHMELARPVYYIQYLSTIIKILRCTCFKCSKLLISKEKYKRTLEGLNSEARWGKVFKLASKIKRCGEDSEDGCGCKQPNKIKKEGLATLFAEWDNIEGLGPDDQDKLSIKLFPEMVLKMFRRISDEDVTFMGFSPTFSRPDWMICQVLAVPPPAVRPSVKHDSQQRSEDDISHILVNIIKANKTLQEKIDQNAPANVIEDWATVLQYYIATQIDNKIPGVASVAQRSGRPLKSIKERLNGKGGRVRGNLMGKRVDFSARSVITPDPNISIRELGVPLKIAKNITKPVVVNDKNRSFLLKLVHNGPDVHPGAKILERKNGENISLRYIDRQSINLENGDIVHRHMMNGDGILFNRQPTLHRMSMMCHIARIMPQADTFRMNVADTKPYNADFDGDEMNLHMPQDVEAETELLNLAAVPWHIISPADNKSIVGIFQDSLLGAYRFTREGINFSQRDAMNLLMSFDKVNSEQLYAIGENVSSFDILSQILPPLSIKYKTKDFNDDENYDTSNHVIDIKNGNISRGQFEKSVLGAGTKGLLQRICNDYGNMAASDFIDNFQNIVTEYMKSSAYSVGISDLLADKTTNDTIVSTITSKKQEVKTLIDQTHLGVFENKTGKTNNEEFETQVNNILNDAAAQAGKIGRKSLSADNRFVIMVNAGSKGSELNISQMISCLGQQNVDGKRIPYGFTGRTLPHFTKYDDSPSARGFVESSFIGGLTPEELFFHAQGGRVGLIDTAVKTSQTGYIQRRLIKGLEDLKVEYDMSVRNSKGKVVQFRYGNDSFDTIKVEAQYIPLVEMSLEDIYAHFHMPSDNLKDKVFTTAYTKTAVKRLSSQKSDLDKKCLEMNNLMIKFRKQIMEMVFRNRNNSKVYLPVAFSYIINNIQSQQNIQSNSLVDITPLEAFELIDNTYNQLKMLHYAKPNELFRAVYYFYLSPKDLLMVKRYNRKALIILLETIVLQYKRAIIAPGEMVGMIAAQSIGEPTTQMTLNTFHFAGVASKSNVTRGVPRVEEILSLSENPKNPSLTIALKESDKTNREKAMRIMNMIEHTKLEDVVSSVQICYDPDDLNTLIEEDQTAMQQFQEFETMVDECNDDEKDQDKDKSQWIIRFEIDPEILLEKNITMDDINFAIKNSYKNEVTCVFTDYNSEKLIFRIRLNKILQNKKKQNIQNPLDQSDNIYLLKNFQDQMLKNIVLRGVKGINKVILRKDPTSMVYEDGKYQKQDSWVLDSVGANLLAVLALDYIDVNQTISNDIAEVYKVLGIEAARQAIHNEFSEVIEGDGGYVNEHHLAMLCDRMTYSYKMISIFRHGINNDNIGPLAKASFEETPEMFLKAARHAELDPLRGVSANIMCGQEGYYGTSSFQVYLDLNKMAKLQAEELDTTTDEEKIMSMWQIENPDDPCSSASLNIQSNCVNIQPEELGNDDDYDIDF